MLAQQPPDLAADRGLAGLAVRPINGEVGTDALGEVSGDRGDLRVGRGVLNASCQRVVEGSLVRGESELLVAPASVAEALGDLYQALDDLGACDLSLLVAGENRLDLLAEDLGLGLVGAGTTFDLALEQLLEQPDLDVGVLGLGCQRVEELVGEHRDIGAVLLGDLRGSRRCLPRRAPRT